MAFANLMYVTPATVEGSKSDAFNVFEVFDCLGKLEIAHSQQEAILKVMEKVIRQIPRWELYSYCIKYQLLTQNRVRHTYNTTVQIS